MKQTFNEQNAKHFDEMQSEYKYIALLIDKLQLHIHSNFFNDNINSQSIKKLTNIQLNVMKSYKKILKKRLNYFKRTFIYNTSKV